ncbi:NAD(P)H-hydrate dehydratase [Candidatus Micrarchaeota archaeon]|nr:NAD(P)H-hydrate dehydratase [Candidatus Micrarchaeota archaeon]
MKLHIPEKDSHKGENGKLLIVGGSKEYHGAPMLAILAARRFVDLIYFYPGENDHHLINAVKTIPEVIVLHDLRKIDEMDCVLSGVGLGKGKFNARQLEAKKLVIDGDGLKRIKGRVPKNAILTPHEGEFRMLFGRSGTENNVKEMANLHKCIILKKGAVDIISNGKEIVTNTVHNVGMTKGGTGDVLAGLVAALACKNDSFTATVAATKIAGNAGNRLKKRYGYNYCASDLANELAVRK